MTTQTLAGLAGFDAAGAAAPQPSSRGRKGRVLSIRPTDAERALIERALARENEGQMWYRKKKIGPYIIEAAVERAKRKLEPPAPTAAGTTPRPRPTSGTTRRPRGNTRPARPSYKAGAAKHREYARQLVAWRRKNPNAHLNPNETTVLHRAKKRPR